MSCRRFTRDKLSSEFNTFGLQLTKFLVENISLPQEVEAAMDKRTSMGVIGDVGRYTQFQAADAMRDAAQNPSGGAGTGAGLGAGFAAWKRDGWSDDRCAQAVERKRGICPGARAGCYRSCVSTMWRSKQSRREVLRRVRREARCREVRELSGGIAPRVLSSAMSAGRKFS
jgi:hypothetical protein